jgi:hypothetical protein
VVLAGAFGALLLAFGLAVSVPQQAFSLTFLLVAALPVCAVIVRWSFAPRHLAVRGARFVLTMVRCVAEKNIAMVVAR